MTGIPGLRGIDHVSLTVQDLAAATRFYCDVIGGRVVYELGPLDAREMPSDSGVDWTSAHLGVSDARLTLRTIEIGSVILELLAFDRPASTLAAPPAGNDVGTGHIGFAVDDLEAAVRFLESQGVTLLSGPIEMPEEAPSGAMLNRYFTDPWGNQLELTERPGR